MSVLACVSAAPAKTLTCDICVYGGTSGGVIAAVQAAKMGKSVVLISDYGPLGGLSSSGLGQTDIGDLRGLEAVLPRPQHALQWRHPFSVHTAHDPL